MFSLKKTEKKFELVLDHVVEATIEYARNYDNTKILKGVPAPDQQELMSRLTHLKGHDFLEKRRELYQKIFKDVFMRDGKVIPPVPNGQKKHRFVMAGTYFSGKWDMFNALFNRDKIVPIEIQQKFDMANNKHTVVIDLRKIREYLPEYQQSLKEGYPYSTSIVRGELDAICQLLLSTAKLCGYNIIDYAKSYTDPLSLEDINVMKGMQHAQSSVARNKIEEYNLYCLGITAEPELILKTKETPVFDDKDSVKKVESALRRFASPDSFRKLMINSDNGFLVWDHGKEKEDKRFQVVAKSDGGDLTISSHVLWREFREQTKANLIETDRNDAMARS